MRCPECRAKNPDEANFCFKCGARLQAVCPQCGAALPAEARFCFVCGASIAMPSAPPAAPPKAPAPIPPPDAVLIRAVQRLVPKEFAERLLATRGHVSGERRMVTLLFSDVKGSTAMSEQLDPEDVMDIMNGAFEVLIPPVYRHEGTLARLMGDAILAFFGAPLSHEDDAARAIRAGLEIVAGAREYAARLERERGITGFNVRVGINTGLVVVGEVGTDLRVEYTAMGDAINLAARLEQNAPVGGILISHDTYQLARGLFDVQALEPLVVKGKAEPVRVYAVQRARPRAFRMATRGVEGIETRTVGREAELKRLQDAFHLSTEDSECQVVTVVGEAGVGKSRLLWEFENWLDETCTPGPHLEVQAWAGDPSLPASSSSSAGRFHARANPELQGVPYALLRDLFVLSFDIQDSDPAQVVRAKLEQGIGRVLGGNERGQMKAHIIGQVLGFDFSASPWVQAVRDDARQLHDRALIYLEELLQTVAAGGTAVMLFEDIHWADDSSLDAISHLVTALAQHRLLVICLARPAIFERRPHWGEGQAVHTCLDLPPLSQSDSRRLVDDILQKMEQVPPALRDLVVAGSEGNPLYVEELIKMLIEQGVIAKAGDGDLPGGGTLQVWRVDEARLGELRVPPTLTAVLQARLDGLPLEQRATLQQAAVVGRTFWDRVIARIAARSEWGEAAVDDGVPAMLSALRGRELVAHQETSAFAGSEEFAFKHAALRQVAYEGILKKVRRGYHSLVADWLIEQSGERAAEHTGLIAEHLERAGRAEEALGYLRQAGEQAAAQFANAEAVRYLTRALALLDQVDWEPQHVSSERYGLLLGREAVHDLVGQRDEQAADLAALEALAGELDDGSSQAAARRVELALRRAHYHESVSDFPAALESAREAVAAAEQAGDARGVTQGLIACGRALWPRSQCDQARKAVDRALALARERGDRSSEAASLYVLGATAFRQDDLQVAAAYYEQALRIHRELGERRKEVMCLSSLANVHVAAGDYSEAQAGFEQALTIDREIGYRRGEAFNLTGLGNMHSNVGALAQARDAYERALPLFRLVGDRRGEGVALGNLALVYVQVGALERARDMSERTLALKQQIGDRAGQMHTLAILSTALHELGNLAAARQYCEQGLALARQIGSRLDEGFYLLSLAGVLEALPEGLEAATGACRSALCLYRELGSEEGAIDCLVELAGLALKQERDAEALSHIREALDWMATHDVQEMSRPVQAYATAADVLNAAGDAVRAAEALAAARAWVLEHAARITDPDMRAGYLAVPLHARVLREQ